MRRYPPPAILAILALLGLSFGLSPSARAASPSAKAAARTAKAPKVELPATVQAAFRSAYPQATIKKVSTETEDGQSCFEVESLDGTTARNLIYRPDGTVVETEEAIAASDLPAAVQKAITTAHPSARILKAEKVMRADTLRFSVRVQVGRKRHQLVYDPNGTRIKATRTAAKGAGKATGKASEKAPKAGS